ncbi:MAG: Asp-tRNA(Asn)/Glu-tRNA(Gln) amidotransferase subunit GatB [Anaerolineaceae bacterium]|nr:MAG: Asp-tRNA(Asn)/Glu-tRNA(Gln) amidotransferase subunit GatB [Anaerolineaceae bacterium]
MTEWITIVGLEVHAEMLTDSKMFSACPVVDSVEAPPNSAVDPLSLGLPGTLPVVNQLAMEYGMMVGLALHCDIPPFCQFARKSYFYPDLPKGYQISQYEHPLAINGYIDIELPDGESKRIGVTRAHMEEDTGKLTHIGGGSSLVDYNRAGVPLLEIVSEPDIRSSAEAESYARKLRAILRYLGVNHGDMSKGVLRFEANVSLMHRDDTEFRTRTEIKNLNSIRSMVRAIDAEVKRQRKLYENGETVKQATLGWDENAGRIIIQRYKERPDEYRYFPDPDLPVVRYSEAEVEAVRERLPELPDAKQARFMQTLGLSEYDARQLVSEKAIADYYEAVLLTGAEPKAAANWILGALFSIFNRESIAREDIDATRISAAQMGELIKLVSGDKLNKGSGEKVLAIMFETGDDPETIIEREGLAQVSDEAAIAAKIDEVLAQHADMAQKFAEGEAKLFGPLMGKTMGAFGGKANPQMVQKILKQKLDALK